MKLKVISKVAYDTIIPVFTGGKINEASYQLLKDEWRETMDTLSEFVTGDPSWNEANQY